MSIPHSLRRPVHSNHALAQRRKTLALGMALAIGIALALAFLLAGCGGGSSNSAAAAAVTPSSPALTLSASDVGNIVQSAAMAVSPTTMVIAVVDRAGDVLALYRKADAPATVTGNFGAQVNANDVAVGLARTGAFFSNNQAPLTSRTVRFISGIHFPPGVANAGNAALYGIENTNRGCTLSGAVEASGLHFFVDEGDLLTVGNMGKKNDVAAHLARDKQCLLVVSGSHLRDRTATFGGLAPGFEDNRKFAENVIDELTARVRRPVNYSLSAYQIFCELEARLGEMIEQVLTRLSGGRGSTVGRVQRPSPAGIARNAFPETSGVRQ